MIPNPKNLVLLLLLLFIPNIVKSQNDTFNYLEDVIIKSGKNKPKFNEINFTANKLSTSYASSMAFDSNKTIGVLVHKAVNHYLFIKNINFNARIRNDSCLNFLSYYIALSSDNFDTIIEVKPKHTTTTTTNGIDEKRGMINVFVNFDFYFSTDKPIKHWYFFLKDNNIDAHSMIGLHLNKNKLKTSYQFNDKGLIIIKDFKNSPFYMDIKTSDGKDNDNNPKICWAVSIMYLADK